MISLMSLGNERWTQCYMSRTNMPDFIYTDWNKVVSLSVLGLKFFAGIYDGPEEVVWPIHALCTGSRAVERFCTRLNYRSQSKVTSCQMLRSGVNHTLPTNWRATHWIFGLLTGVQTTCGHDVMHTNKQSSANCIWEKAKLTLNPLF